MCLCMTRVLPRICQDSINILGLMLVFTTSLIREVQCWSELNATDIGDFPFVKDCGPIVGVIVSYKGF